MGIDSYAITGLFDGITLSNLQGRTLAKLKQKAGNYNRYSAGQIQAALNDGLIEAAKITKHLRGFAIIILKDGYSQYKPPSDLLLPDKFFFYESATSYYELAQKSRRWLDRFKPGWRAIDGDPLYYFPGDHYGTMKKLGFYPRPDTDGTSYSTSDDTGVYVSESSMTTTGNVTGTASAASGTVLTDSAGRTLEDEGVYAGMMGVNVTTGDSGQISSVSGSTATFSASDFPSGWSIGDSFNILAGEYGIVVDWANDEEYLFTAEIGGMVDVRTVVNNVYMEYIRRPLLLQYDNQYPQLPPDLHQFLPDYAVWSIKRNSPRGSQDANEAAAGRAAFYAGIGGYIDLDEAVDDDGCQGYYLAGSH